MRSFLFPQMNKQVLSAGRINLPKIWRIVKRASGFYAMLSLQQDIEIPEPQPHGNVIGIDVGIKSFLATSAGERNEPQYPF